MGQPIGRPGALPCPPAVADEALDGAELALLQHLASTDEGATHDEVQYALVLRRLTDQVQSGLELLHCQMLHLEPLQTSGCRPEAVSPSLHVDGAQRERLRHIAILPGQKALS